MATKLKHHNISCRGTTTRFSIASFTCEPRNPSFAWARWLCFLKMLHPAGDIVKRLRKDQNRRRARSASKHGDFTLHLLFYPPSPVKQQTDTKPRTRTHTHTHLTMSSRTTTLLPLVAAVPRLRRSEFPPPPRELPPAPPYPCPSRPALRPREWRAARPLPGLRRPPYRSSPFWLERSRFRPAGSQCEIRGDVTRS